MMTACSILTTVMTQPAILSQIVHSSMKLAQLAHLVKMDVVSVNMEALHLVQNINNGIFSDSTTTCQLTTEDSLSGRCSGEYTTVNPLTTTVGPTACNIDFLTVDDECYIFSPNWPSSYPNSACKQWNIRSGSQGLINLSFQYFEVHLK
jgi:hypothetical protein